MVQRATPWTLIDFLSWDWHECAVAMSHSPARVRMGAVCAKRIRQHCWSAWTFCALGAFTLCVSGQPLRPASTNVQESQPALDQSLKEANQLWLKEDAKRGPAYEHLLPEVEKVYGKESPIVGLVLFRIGFSHAAQGNFEAALPELEHSLSLVKPLPDDESNRLTKGNLYWGLGLIYKSLLKNHEAFVAFEQALQYKESLRGKEDPELLATLNPLADLCSAEHRPLDAIQLLQRALAISEKAFGRESPEVAQALASLGNTWKSAQNFDASLSCLKRSLEIRERVFAATNEAVASAAGNLGSLYLDWGRYSEAIPLLERSVEVFGKNLATTNMSLPFQMSVALNNLAVAQISTGEYQNGIATLQRSLVITETNFGSASVNLAAALNSMAVTLQQQGDFERALPLSQRAVRILEDAPPHKLPELVDSINNLAELYRKAGDDATALRLFNRSKDLAESQFGPEYISVAFSLNGIALIAQQRHDAAGALANFERALAILEKKPGRPQGDAAGILNNMSALLNSTGDTNRALSTLQKALSIQEKLLLPSDPAIATALNNLAVHLTDRGDTASARNLLRRSLAITDAALGKNNPDSCTRLENLGVVEILGGDLAAGLGDFAESSKRWRRYLGGQLTSRRTLGASRSQNALQSSRDWFHSTCGAVQGALLRAAAVSGAEELALSKALLEEVEATAARLASDGGVQLRELSQQRNSVQHRLEALAPPGGDTLWAEERTAWRTSERDRLEQQLKVIDEKIGSANEWIGTAIREWEVSLRQLARSLPSGTAFIDLVQFRRTAFCCGEQQWKERRYAAYLTLPLAPDSTNLVVERVDLGEAAPIDETVQFICERMSTGRGYAREDFPAALRRLGGLVYAPLAKYLTNVSHLIVCPDGQLSRLPFEMLRVGDRYLVEEKAISYVTSGREIVRLAGSLQSKVQSPKSLVMGAPDFDLDLSKAGNVSFQVAGAPARSARGSADAKQDALPLTGGSRALFSLSPDYRGMRFSMEGITNTEAEARSVAALLGGDCVLRLGAEAREAELKAVQSPWVLHLATHGFCLSDQDFRRTNALGDSWIGNSGTRWNASSQNEEWENPLVRCGIALAGANHASQITNAMAEDGLLTGLEASLLNLQRTELVILSACDTGKGEVKIGEGVMSLRRAFRIAGAQTVLASHWNANDKATSRLITEFMQRWQAGEPRGKAWRESQLSLLHSEEYKSPYVWAAFTLTGQWK